MKSKTLLFSLYLFYLLVNSIMSTLLSKQKQFINLNNNNNKRSEYKILNPYRQTNRNVRHSISSSTTAKPSAIEQTNLTAKVGETVILNCIINSSYGINPGVLWMQGSMGNVLTLNRNRITLDSRFEIISQPIQQQPVAPIQQQQQSQQPQQLSHREKIQKHISSNSSSTPDNGSADLALEKNNKQLVNLNEFSYYHLKITNVQLYDENEYACETSLTTRNEDQPNLHSLVYLHVTQSPSFIESLTSESNLAALEYSNQVLKCSAVGKPNPKIKWYQIDELNGIIRDLNHESPILTLKNISKYENTKYECVASNGILPSVSKKFTINVFFSPIVKPTLEKTNQYLGQTVTIGCTIHSNPESTISWFKLEKGRSISKPLISISNSLIDDSSYVPIEHLNSKYQIHKSKQSNQTVSYLKVKNLESNDFSSYKCEASNTVGKHSAVIELFELKEISNMKSEKTKALQLSKMKSNLVKNEAALDEEELELDDAQYYMNLDSERSGGSSGTSPDDLENSVDNEYKLVTKLNEKNRNYGANKKKLMKYNYRNENNLNSLNSSQNRSSLFRHPVGKTNRIIENDNHDDENSLKRVNDLPSDANKLRIALTSMSTLLLSIGFFI